MEFSEVHEALAVLRRWLADAAVPDGAFEQDALTYRGLFKAPLGFASVGLFSDAARSVDLITDRLTIRPDGDVAEPASAAADAHPAPSLQFFYPYRTGYIALGAHRVGRYDLSRRVGAFVLSLQDPACGGFLAQPGLSPPRFHICGTARAALTALALGEWAAAVKAGDFLVRALEVAFEYGTWLTEILKELARPGSP